jgi:hypothetical protein
MYNDPNCKPWTSQSWAPLGYSSRHDYHIQKKTVEEKKTFGEDSGENATGVTVTTTGTISGSVGSFGNENEKGTNGIRISVPSVENRTSCVCSCK